jgi:hypothetical protein
VCRVDDECRFDEAKSLNSIVRLRQKNQARGMQPAKLLVPVSERTVFFSHNIWFWYLSMCVDLIMSDCQEMIKLRLSLKLTLTCVWYITCLLTCGVQVWNIEAVDAYAEGQVECVMPMDWERWTVDVRLGSRDREGRKNDRGWLTLGGHRQASVHMDE